MAFTSLATEGGTWGTQIPIIPQPAELIIGLIAFGVIYFIYKKYVVPRLEQMYDERTAAIEGGMEQAEEAQAQAAAAKAKYDEQLSHAQGEASKIREDAKAQGATIISEAREQANVEAERIVAAAHKQTEAERQQASVQLRSEVGTISTNLASRIVGESLEDDVRRRGIVDRFLADLESGAVKPEKVGSTGPEAGS
ncbi:F0F1 ATP synthase subunit B [Dermatophilaceae bacterium Sec6.4]|nr:F0F1 ATP synthase subunit B [Actinomycetota bacterium]